MAKEKVQNEGQTMHRPQTRYNIKYKQSNGKKKVQNKVQAIQWPKKKFKIKYRQSNGQRKSTK